MLVTEVFSIYFAVKGELEEAMQFFGFILSV